MFGIGLGEILLIVFIVFIISPRDVPKVMRKIGQFFGEIDRIKRELLQIKKDVEDIVEETKKDVNDAIYDAETQLKNEINEVEKEIKKDNKFD